MSPPVVFAVPDSSTAGLTGETARERRAAHGPGSLAPPLRVKGAPSPVMVLRPGAELLLVSHSGGGQRIHAAFQ
ncbi:hypothetical protein [Streptomyces levis]|uniref:hypothetical protein n=1 Tax=Streptomyces levis TaxID=285566 RepID=UPI0031DB9307